MFDLRNLWPVFLHDTCVFVSEAFVCGFVEGAMRNGSCREAAVTQQVTRRCARCVQRWASLSTVDSCPRKSQEQTSVRTLRQQHGVDPVSGAADRFWLFFCPLCFR